MSNIWFLLVEDEPRSGADNMAVDAYLLDLVERGVLDRPVLRVYGWSKPTLSLGYHQEWRQTVQPDALKHYDVDLVRRWTGGRAVLHDHEEITYSVIAPFKAPFEAKIAVNYHLIGQALHEFTSIGDHTAQLSTAEETTAEIRRMRHAPCFASLSQSEIETGGRKLIGSAQKLSKNAFLQHGSIPLKHRPEVLRELTGSDLDLSDLMTDMPAHFRDAGLMDPSREELVERLVGAFAHQFNLAFTTLQDLGLPVEEEVDAIAVKTFADDAWTYRK